MPQRKILLIDEGTGMRFPRVAAMSREKPGPRKSNCISVYSLRLCRKTKHTHCNPLLFLTLQTPPNQNLPTPAIL